MKRLVSVVVVVVALVLASLAEHGVQVEVRDSFGEQRRPVGLKTIIVRRPS